jgi:uncharacterized protein (UPF0332 family)
MEKIKWCLEVKNGIELIEPNDNLSKAYLKKSEDALKASSVLKDNRDWEISSGYYAMYFALYAILMKLGVKCENHSCTIEFMKEFLREYFNEEDITLIGNSMVLRIDAQYYTNKEIPEIKYKKMLKEAPEFLVKCKDTIARLNEEKINAIRKKLMMLQKF